MLEVLTEGRPSTALLLRVRNEDHARLVREDLATAGCDREALTADDAMRAPIVFHGFRDTCLTHMAVRRDPPQSIQWVATRPQRPRRNTSPKSGSPRGLTSGNPSPGCWGVLSRKA